MKSLGNDIKTVWTTDYSLEFSEVLKVWVLYRLLPLSKSKKVFQNYKLRTENHFAVVRHSRKISKFILLLEVNHMIAKQKLQNFHERNW